MVEPVHVEEGKTEIGGRKKEETLILAKEDKPEKKKGSQYEQNGVSPHREETDDVIIGCLLKCTRNVDVGEELKNHRVITEKYERNKLGCVVKEKIIHKYLKVTFTKK